MARVPVPEARSSVVDTPNGLEVTIPARKNWFAILFIGFWMIGWAVGEIFALRELLSGRAPFGAALFLLAWLGAWTVGGALAGYSWLWMVRGVERVVLTPELLIITREVFGFGRRREYDLAHVRNLRPVPAVYNPYDFSASASFWGAGGGAIAFDYGAKTFRFALALDEAEASAIIDRLKSRYPFK